MLSKRELAQTSVGRALLRTAEKLRAEQGGLGPKDCQHLRVGKFVYCPKCGGKLPRIEVCQCGRTFEKVTRKAFCSTRCQSRYYMRGYRARGG